MSSNLKNRFLVRAAAVALSSATLMLAGCALQSTASDGNSFVQAATITGQVHGGQQPIAGATVSLYAVGTTGYGLGAKLLATTTSANGSGSFSFTQKATQTGADNPVDASYGCPTSSTLIYIVASGGDSTGVGTAGNVNSHTKLIGALGQCSAIGTSFVSLNEVVTVATVAALQQYMSPTTEVIGAPSTTGSGSNMSSASTGIANAFATALNLVNVSTGTANATYTPASAVGTVTATVESAKINTIADIIAACINTTGSSSSQCSTLFAAATSPTIPSTTNFSSSYTPAVTASDTVQATLFMLQNPTDAGTQVTSCAFGTATTNLGCLFAAQTASAPFVGLTAAPNDWTIGVTFASASVTTISGSTVAGVMQYPEYLAIDKLGDVWIANGVTTALSLNTQRSSLLELSPQGGTLKQVLTGGQLFGPQVPAIDPSGNVWIPNFGSSTASNATGYGTTVVEYPASGTPATGNSFTVGGCPFGVASDGVGNIFVGECSGSVTNTGGGNGTPGNDVREILSTAAAGSTATALSGLANYVGSGYSEIAVDSNFTVWTTSDTASITAIPLISGAYTTSYINTTAITDSASLSIDNSNDAWIGNYAATGGTVSEVSVVGGVITPASGSPFGSSLVKASLSAIDGAQNVWITSDASTGPVSEYAHTGALITPTTGYSHQYYYPTGIAIDPSGNVWIGNDAADTRAAVAGYTATGGYVTMIVGAAVPVVTPIAAGLPTTAGGKSYLATPPQ